MQHLGTVSISLLIDVIDFSNQNRRNIRTERADKCAISVLLFSFLFLLNKLQIAKLLI